jgi:L-rhamnonate dehydratase
MRDSNRIVSVRASVVKSGQFPPEPDIPDLNEEAFNWRRQKVANPLTKYPEFRDNRSAGHGEVGGNVIVQVESASGHVGIGTTSGGLAALAIIELHLAGLVEGQDAFAHELIWDRMFGGTLLYGRKGLVLHAISAVDLAVWDLHGKITETPVYSLLGGPITTDLTVYGTGPSAAPIEKAGFWGAKLPLTWGPSEGEDGFRRNVARAQAARDSVGPDFPLLYDCWMALNVDYAVRLAEAVEPLGFRWLEEPLAPDDYAGHAELRRRLPPGMTLNTGEHEYTHRGFKLLCEAGVDVIQPDPNWCGGITEMRRIAAVASAFGKRIIPHVGGVYSYHFLASYPDVTFAEFPMMAKAGDVIVPMHAPVLLGEPLPENGVLHVGEEPGFGLTLNEDVELLRPITREFAASL